MDQINERLNTYFEEMYNPPLAQSDNNLQSEILWTFQPVIDDQMIEGIMCKVKEEEVRVAIFNMNQYKAPNPEGFSLPSSRFSRTLLSMTLFML